MSDNFQLNVFKMRAQQQINYARGLEREAQNLGAVVGNSEHEALYSVVGVRNSERKSFNAVIGVRSSEREAL